MKTATATVLALPVTHQADVGTDAVELTGLVGDRQDLIPAVVLRVRVPPEPAGDLILVVLASEHGEQVLAEARLENRAAGQGGEQSGLLARR